MIWNYDAMPWEMFYEFQMISWTVLRLNNNYIGCLICPSSYLVGRFCQIFSTNLISFVNSTQLGCVICMSQVLGVLHAVWCCLRIRIHRVTSFDALNG